MDFSVDVGIWTLDATERDHVVSKRCEHRLTIAFLLKSFRQAERFPATLSDLTPEVAAYLAEQLGVPEEPRILSVRTMARTRSDIRQYYGYREAGVRDSANLSDWLCKTAVAETRNHGRLVQALEAECRRRKLDPPTADRLDRILR